MNSAPARSPWAARPRNVAIAAAAVAVMVCGAIWPMPIVGAGGALIAAFALYAGIRQMIAEHREAQHAAAVERAVARLRFLGEDPAADLLEAWACGEHPEHDPDESGPDPDSARTDPDPADPRATDQAGHDPDALRNRVAAALYRHEWPNAGPWADALAMDRETFLALARAVLAELAPELERGTEGLAARRLAADGIRRVAAARGWSDWAAAYIHPDEDFDQDAVEAEHRTRAEQLEELLDIAHETSNTSEAARAAAVQRAEEAETALAARIPLICSDERHQAKVAALEAEVQRMRYYVAACGEDGHAVRMAATATQRAEEATAALAEIVAAVRTVTDADTGERIHIPGHITPEQYQRWQQLAHGQEPTS